MIEGYDIICFSNDWDGDPLSKKHIMRRLARKNRVLWVNSIGNRNPTASARDFRRAFGKLKAFFGGCREVAPNIHVLSPIAIPFHGSALARRINRSVLVWMIRKAIQELGFKNRITWTFLPSSADVVGRLGEQMIIYHCTDEFSEFTGSARDAILSIEHRLMMKANHVIVSAERLYQNKVQHNPDTWLVRHGVDVEHFRKACDPSTEIPKDIAWVRGYVIGFFGLVADWVDLKLIRELALARPACSFVLIGKVDTDTSVVRDLPNVHLLGQKPYDSLPAYCRRFDIAILPFVINELTLNANPLKIREYLAAGLPVLSVPIPEVEAFGGLVHICRTVPDFVRRIDDLLASGQNGPSLARSKDMDTESWDEKVEEMSRVVQGTAHHTELAMGA